MTTLPSIEEMLNSLRSQANSETLKSQTRFGISGHEMLGISIYDLRKMARGIKSHTLALELWHSGIHEARILAAMVDDPEQVTPPPNGRLGG